MRAGVRPSAAAAACSDANYIKRGPARPKRKSAHPVPLLDCSTAGCEGGCPFGQDIPAYIELCRKGLYAEALSNVVKVDSLEEIMAMPHEAFAEPDQFINEFITGTHPNDTHYKHLVRSAASNNERER